MKADYKTMDIEKAIEIWNDGLEIYGHDENDDLWIFDNDRGGLDTIFLRYIRRVRCCIAWQL